MTSSDMFHRVAVLTCALCTITVVVMALALPAIYMRAEAYKMTVQSRSTAFKATANRLWDEMMSGSGQSVDSPSVASLLLRHKRAGFAGAVCGGCAALNCPTGAVGLPGDVGADGVPGSGGKGGKLGIDGMDIQLEPEADLPCVICPGGPHGLRGPQGERGVQGTKGSMGGPGIYGKKGLRGEGGSRGRAGKLGHGGFDGKIGRQGETVVAGHGIKGPRGPPGSQGPKGPPGLGGRPSNVRGNNGIGGKHGPNGPPGKWGIGGEQGPWGVSGEPGMPGTYCPADCGVSQIIAPSLTPQHNTYGLPQQSYGAQFRQ